MHTVTVVKFTKAEIKFLNDQQAIIVKYWLDMAQYFTGLRRPNTDSRGLKVLTGKITRYQREAGLVAGMTRAEFSDYYDQKHAEYLATGKVTPVTQLVQPE